MQAGDAKPLFPFGYGLSYTTFRYAGFTVDARGTSSEPEIAVSFRITNVGSRKGSDVPQIYVGFPHIAEGDEPPLQLKGFQKLTLGAGESRTVRIVLHKDAFSYWSESQGAWKIASGIFKIMLAISSEDIRDTKNPCAAMTHGSLCRSQIVKTRS
jgi:beta-glucosidase